MGRRTRTRPAKHDTAPQRPLRFAIYLRISRDPDGTSLATERQLKDCQAFAELRGWDVTEVFEDADLSAFRRGVVRPEYERMLDGLRAGRFDGVLVWRLDRLVRRTFEFARFWEVCEAAGARLASATQPIDTSDPVGMLIVHVLIAFAQMESETMSLRITAQQRQSAEAGRPKGTRRAYGIAEGWAELVEHEAAVIRQAAADLLAGRSLGTIVRALNDAGTSAPGGGTWDRVKLRELLRAPRLWGWREYHGELLAKGDWPAVLDEATGRAVADLLDGQRTGTPSENRRRNLLSGLIRCVRCNTPLKGGKGSDGERRYICPPRSEGGCSGIAMQADLVDATVEALIVDRLAAPGILAGLRARLEETPALGQAEADLLDELAEVRRMVDQSAEDWAAGNLPRPAYLAEQRALERRADDANAALAALRRRGPLVVIGAGDDPNEAYQSLDLAQKRAVIQELTMRITALRKDSPQYLDRLRVSLADEAEEFDAKAQELSERAGKADGDEAKALRAEARRYQKWASRRRVQARDGTGGGRWRPERIDVDWRA